MLVRRLGSNQATIWFNRNFNLETREEDPEVWTGMFDVEGSKVGETVKMFVIMDYEKFLKDGRIIEQAPSRWSWSLFRRKPPMPPRPVRAPAGTGPSVSVLKQAPSRWSFFRRKPQPPQPPPMPVRAPDGTGPSASVLTGGRRKSRRVKKRHASRRARTRTRRSKP